MLILEFIIRKILLILLLAFIMVLVASPVLFAYFITKIILSVV